MISLAAIDFILIAAYFGAILVIGFLASRRHADASDFLLAGRSLTLPLFVMTLVSTWYGGILGVGEFSYLYGISNWFVQGVPYYVFAMLFAFLLAKRIRDTNLTTIPDKLHLAYDRRTAVLGGFLTFLLTTPAPYILMLAILLQLLTGWSLLLCVVLGTLATTAYLFSGGFRADIHTDVFEFLLMFAGFAVILPYAFTMFGGVQFIRQNVPATHLTWHGGNSAQFIVVWFLIALWTLVDPAFHQRCYAAKSGKVAQRGILVSIGFWFVFDAMTATAGLYARAAVPDLANPVMAFPMLAEITLPPVAKGLFYIGMLATIMSSLNTLAFVSATSLGRDVLWRMRGELDERNVNRYTRWALCVVGVISMALALVIPSVVRLWYTIGTVIVPGLLVPLVTAYFDVLKPSAKVAYTAMVSGWLVSLIWLVLGWSQHLGSSGHYPFGIEPMFPGLVVSVLIWGAGRTGKHTSAIR